MLNFNNKIISWGNYYSELELNNTDFTYRVTQFYFIIYYTYLPISQMYIAQETANLTSKAIVKAHRQLIRENLYWLRVCKVIVLPHLLWSTAYNIHLKSYIQPHEVEHRTLPLRWWNLQ